MVVPASQRPNRFQRGVLQDPTALSVQVCCRALALDWSHWQARTKRTAATMATMATAMMPMTPKTAKTASAAQIPRALLRP
jgi:hypothetical protein